MIRGVHHVAISTPNLERIVAFYRDVVGAEVVYEGGWVRGSPVIDRIVGLADSEAKQAMLKLGNAYLEFFEYVSPPGAPKKPGYGANDHGYTHFCLDVQDIDAEYERLTRGGMTFNCPPPNFPGSPVRATYGRDPDGNIVEIQEIRDPQHGFALERTRAGVATQEP
jgi:catechol 2,3-dioxygenase-like lactoylglutathione lyase family enzyme